MLNPMWKLAFAVLDQTTLYGIVPLTGAKLLHSYNCEDGQATSGVQLM